MTGMQGLCFAVALGVLLGACGVLRPDPPLQVTLVRTDQPPLAVLDNCPALREVTLTDADGPVWAILRRSPSPNAAHLEMRLGGEPNGWEIVQELSSPLLAETNYTLETSPGGNELSFRLSELDIGRSATENGQQDLVRADATQDCNGSVAWGDLWRQGAVFFLLGLLVLLVVGTALVKALQVFVPQRTDAAFDEEFAEDDPDFDGWDEPTWDESP